MRTSIPCTLAILGSVLGIFGCGTPTTGLTEGGLVPCPDRPNCVTSQGGDARHAVAPIRYQGSRSDAVARLRGIVSSQPGATVVETTANYLHAEFRSRVFRFVDDVEFWFPEDRPVIHVRSAARLGYADLGVNRRRVERLRRLFGGETPAE